MAEDLGVTAQLTEAARLQYFMNKPTGLADVQNFSLNDEFQEYDHRHTYLFEYDVVWQVLGDEYAEKCDVVRERWEEHDEQAKPARNPDAWFAALSSIA